MKYLMIVSTYLISLIIISMTSFSVMAAPINKTDLAVVEKMYKEIGLSIADIDTTSRVDHIDIEIKVSTFVDIDPYDKNKRKLSLHAFLLNESGRVVYLRVPGGVDGQKLISLEGVEKLEALEVLKIYNHDISDLKPLSKLKNIRGLELAKNNIKNASYLRNLSKLEFLNLSYNSLESTRFFSGLKGLKSLECQPCNIMSLKGMEVMKSLQVVDIDAEGITSIAPLRRLKELRSVIISVGDVVDFSPLAGKLKLERLHVEGGGGGALDVLKVLINLREIVLVNNSFTEIPNLSDLKKINRINFSNTKIKKITGLENLSSLENLTLNFNKNLTKIEGLDGLISLRDLEFKGSAIKKMENLNLQSLEKLDLSKTDITKMENMSGMPELFFIELYETNIKKIEGYREAPKLTDIGIEYTPEFSNNNRKAIDFLDKRKKDTYSFLLD
jgi:internalin A